MNPRSELKVLKDWKDQELNSLTLTLTPALSLGERENSFPRIGNRLALDLTRFRGSMREMVRGILSPLRGEGNAERRRGIICFLSVANPGSRSNPKALPSTFPLPSAKEREKLFPRLDKM
jgi:hypothetical protein